MTICLILLIMFLLATTITCLDTRNVTVACIQHERQALLKFKQSVQYDNHMLSSWVGGDCCKWKRVKCDVVTGNVEGLLLRGSKDYLINYDNPRSQPTYNIGGEYLVGSGMSVNHLEGLKHLKHLDLSDNDFQGSEIPKFIGSLKNLSYLNLSDTRFSGNIPHHIGNLSSLKILDFSSNDLIVDDMTWISSLSSLEHLDLSQTDLSGARNSYMVFHMIPSLKVLSLSDCRMNYSSAVLGPLLNTSAPLFRIRHLDLSQNTFKNQHLSFIQNMTSLEFLDLSSSIHLSDSWNTSNWLFMIPSLIELHLSSCDIKEMHLSPSRLNVSTFSNIHHLDLSWNNIDTFPSVLTNMTSLRVLDLSYNNITTPVLVISNLVELDLFANPLHSSVPVMPNLLKLEFSYNNYKHIGDVGIWRQCHLKQLSVTGDYEGTERIYSPINESECSQYALESLYVDGILLSTIPEYFKKLANLRNLYLTYAGLTGPVPRFLGSLSSLQVLDLSHNQLSGHVPTFTGSLTKLDLSYNLLNGSIPESFTRLKDLTQLVLRNNMLTGAIPESIGRLALLQRFSVSSNLINGTIPVSIGKLTKLQIIGISKNSLNGMVSEAHFANLSMLKYMDFSLNGHLTFNVSWGWMPPFQLVSLDLGSIKIEYGFPLWLRTQGNLAHLSLANTSISGTLPTWLKKMPIIPFLDLSHNKLSGPLTNLPDGENFNDESPSYSFYENSFVLQDNLFNGSIPKSICRRTRLVALQISNNRLTGEIPKCLGDLQQLQVLILGSNALSGPIPCSLGNCSGLAWLQLNDNNFSGELPQELKNLNLEVLDLGGNEFSGNLLPWVAESNYYLMVLRLHRNNFSGTIPQSLCTLVYLQVLDVSENNLTGTIPNCLGNLSMVEQGVTMEGDPFLEYSLIQVLKGTALEYTTAWTYVVNMDLSSNNLVGEIPVEITRLKALMGLNLSNNHLSGAIPNNIGNMKALESIDFSRNEFTGSIPPSIAKLTSLSYLNLSHNNLSGRIPTGSQLQTLIDPSIYDGNKDLCGAPLEKNCSNHEHLTPKPNNKYEAVHHDSKRVWYYLDIMSGFATGFWGFIGVLVFKKHWRQKLFMFVESTTDKIYVAVAIRVAKMQRRRTDPFRVSGTRQ